MSELMDKVKKCLGHRLSPSSGLTIITASVEPQRLIFALVFVCLVVFFTVNSKVGSERHSCVVHSGYGVT